MELVIDRGVKSYDVKDVDGTLLVASVMPSASSMFSTALFVSARIRAPIMLSP